MGGSSPPVWAVNRRILFRPAAVRDFPRLDRAVQARIDAALVRYAGKGDGDARHSKIGLLSAVHGLVSGGSFSAWIRPSAFGSWELTTAARRIDPAHRKEYFASGSGYNRDRHPWTANLPH